MGCRAALLAAALCGAATAKYADEAGRWDFHKEVFGGLRRVAFRGTSGRVYVAAKGAVVGSVAKDGSVQWRRIVGGCDAVDALTFSASGGFVAAACANGAAAAFSADGEQLWQGDVSLAGGAAVVGVSAQTEAEYASFVTVDAKQAHIYPLVTDKGSFHLGDASHVALPEGADAASAGVSGAALHVVAGGALRSLALSGTTWEAAAAELPAGASAGWAVDRSAAAPLQLRSGGDCFAPAAKRRSTGGFCLPDGAAAALAPLLADTAETGGAREVFSVAVGEKWAAVVVFRSGDTAHATAAGTTWRRDDGLGDVTGFTPFKNTDDEDEEETRSPVATYARLLQQQAAGVADRIARVPEMVQEAAATMMGTAAPKVYKRTAVEKQFGLQRKFIFYSPTMLYRIDSDDGTVYQRTHVAHLAGKPGADVRVVKVLNDEHHAHSTFVWARDSAADYAISVTHNTVEAVQLPTRAKFCELVRSFEYTHDEGVVSTAVVFILADNKVVAHPQSARYTGVPFFHYHVDEATGALTGYAVDDKAAREVWHTNVVSRSEEKVAATSLATFDRHQFIAADNIKVYNASGKTEVLSKYTNPNAVLVVTAVDPKQAPAKDGEEPVKREAYLVMYIVDGVTGAVLNSMVQPNAVGPVNVVALEHMYLVHFFNTKRRRYQLAALELFENTQRLMGMTAQSTTNVKQIWDSFVGYDHLTQYSSFEVGPPQLRPTAFTFPTGVRQMGVTVSELGVGTKQLLVALTSDEVVMVDIARHLEANQREGISTIAWLPTSTVTYGRTVLGISQLRSLPTRLESTALLVGFGNDIFFSRVTSGKPFDMLNEDFGYIPLFLSVVGTLAATATISHLAKRAQQKILWA